MPGELGGWAGELGARASVLAAWVQTRRGGGPGCRGAGVRQGRAAGGGGHCCDRATHSKLARGDEGPQQAEGPVHAGSGDGSLGRESQRGAPLRPQRGAAPANSEA